MVLQLTQNLKKVLQPTENLQKGSVSSTEPFKVLGPDTKLEPSSSSVQNLLKFCILYRTFFWFCTEPFKVLQPTQNPEKSSVENTEPYKVLQRIQNLERFYVEPQKVLIQYQSILFRETQFHHLSHDESTLHNYQLSPRVDKRAETVRVNSQYKFKSVRENGIIFQSFFEKVIPTKSKRLQGGTGTKIFDFSKVKISMLGLQSTVDLVL